MFGLINSIKRKHQAAKKINVKQIVKIKPFPCYALPFLEHKNCECIDKCKFGPSSPGQEILDLAKVFLKEKKLKIQL
jgi:CMP-N-acetylneuraminic acid synthetase